MCCRMTSGMTSSCTPCGGASKRRRHEATTRRRHHRRARLNVARRSPTSVSGRTTIGCLGLRSTGFRKPPHHGATRVADQRSAVGCLVAWGSRDEVSSVAAKLSRPTVSSDVKPPHPSPINERNANVASLCRQLVQEFYQEQRSRSFSSAMTSLHETVKPVVDSSLSSTTGNTRRQHVVVECGAGRRLGLAVGRQQGHGPVEVKVMRRGCEGYLAGLELGDQILSVNGRDVTGESVEVVAELLRSSAGSASAGQLELVVSRQTDSRLAPEAAHPTSWKEVNALDEASFPDIIGDVTANEFMCSSRIVSENSGKFFDHL